MLSQEAAGALFLCASVLVMMIVDTPAAWWQSLIAMTVMFLVLRSWLYLASACPRRRSVSTRTSVLRSQFGQSLDVRLRNALPGPVIEVPILDLGVARVRFFDDSYSTWMRLRFKCRALDRAPWLHLQGAPSFWLPTRIVGARALMTGSTQSNWRYWRLPWRPADSTVEGLDFCASLPSTERPLVLTSRPGHLVIRGEKCRLGDNVVFRNAVRLAIAWVEAVQRAATEP